MDRELAVGSGAGSIAGRDRARRTYSREGRGAYRIGVMPSTQEFLALWFGSVWKICARRSGGSPTIGGITRVNEWRARTSRRRFRSEEHTSELQSLRHLVCR